MSKLESFDRSVEILPLPSTDLMPNSMIRIYLTKGTIALDCQKCKSIRFVNAQQLYEVLKACKEKEWIE